MTVKNTMSASIAVMTMCDVTVKVYGMRPIRFRNRMNMNSENTNGKNLIPSLPAVLLIVSATNS